MGQEYVYTIGWYPIWRSIFIFSKILLIKLAQFQIIFSLFVLKPFWGWDLLSLSHLNNLKRAYWVWSSLLISFFFLNTIYFKKIGQNSDIDKNQLGVKCDPSTSNHNKTETTSYLFIAGTLIFLFRLFSTWWVGNHEIRHSTQIL